jgi:hypothetical protein
VTETADEEQAVQFITDVDTVAANDGDSEQVDPIQSRLEERDLLPREHIVDQGYTSSPNLAKSDGFKEELKERSAVEGTISEFTRCHGGRRACYRGKSKVRLQHLSTGAAVNIKRLARALALPNTKRTVAATGSA